MNKEKFKLTLSLLSSSLFGFVNTLILTYIHYRAYLMPSKCILVCINRYGEMWLDFVMCVLSLIATSQGVIYSLFVLFRNGRKEGERHAEL